MKSIFKKIAFVLALAMVVTAFPAQTAGAAAKGPQLKAHRVLYLGGDATETYGEKAYATVWNFKEDGYTVKFESRDPEIATVGAGKGMVTAVSVGTTIVTATFSKKGERDIVKECKVEVKKNAAAVSLDEASEKALAELTVGSTVTLKAVAADGDGGNDATDFIKFKSDDENVVAVDKKTGELKAVAAGKANVTVYTHQYEYDFEAKKYASKTTAEKVYAVEVKEGGLQSAKQISFNTVAITCDSEVIASEIEKDIQKLKAVYVLTQGEVTVFVKSAKVDSSNKKVVNVELYNNLVKDTTYHFTYGNGDPVSVIGADLEAIKSIRISTTRAVVEKYEDIWVEFLDANGIIVKRANDVFFEAEPSTDYALVGNQIYFFEAGKAATVKATYDMGYDTKTGNKIPDLTCTGVIVSFSEDSSIGTINGWAVDGDLNKKASDLTYTTNIVKLAINDTRQLYVRFDETDYYGKVTAKYNKSSDTSQVSGEYSYQSSNDTVLLVEADGVVKPVGKGSAQVIVKRINGNTESVVGVVGFEVSDARKLATVNLKSDYQRNLSTAGNDSVRLVLELKDQLGEGYHYGQTTWEASTDTDGVDVTFVEDTWDGIKFDVTASGTFETKKTVKVTIKITDIRNTSFFVTRVIALSVQTPADKVATYRIDGNVKGTDVNLLAYPSWENSGAAYYAGTFSLKTYDKDGYYMGVQPVLPVPEGHKYTAAGFYAEVIKNNQDKADSVAAVEADGKVSIKLVTTTPSAITGSAITINKGNVAGIYTIRVYEVTDPNNNGKFIERPIAAKQIVVTDSTPNVVVSQKENTLTGVPTSTDGAVVAGILQGADVLTFTRSGKNITGDLTLLNAQFTQTGNRLYITKVQVSEVYSKLGEGATYTYWIDVNKVFILK